jgi:hypothetical protein
MDSDEQRILRVTVIDREMDWPRTEFKIRWWG